MNTVKDLRQSLSDEVNRLQPPADLEARVLQQALRSAAAVAPAHRAGPRGTFRSWESKSVESPRLMVFTAALLAVAIIVTLVLAAHALHVARNVPVKPGPHGGVTIHSVSMKPGPPGGVRDPIPLQPAAAVQCSAPSATYGCMSPSAPIFGTSSVGWTTAGSAAAEGPTNLYRTDDGGKHWSARLSWDYSEANDI